MFERNRKTTLFPLLFAALLGAIPAVVRADAVLSTSVQVSGLAAQCNQSGIASAQCSAQGSVSFAPDDSASFGGVAQARASFGDLGTFASALGSCDVLSGPGISCPDEGGTVGARATFSDLITISNAPASGSLVFAFKTDGSDMLTCLNGSLCAPILPGTDLVATGGSNGEQIFALANGTNSLNIPFVFQSSDGTASFGVEFTLTSAGGCSTLGTFGVSLTCTAVANFFDTAAVTGVTVLDANGNPISGATITTASGVNYNNVTVPEPGTLTLLSSALFGLGCALKHRKPLSHRD